MANKTDRLTQMLHALLNHNGIRYQDVDFSGHDGDDAVDDENDANQPEADTSLITTVNF